MGDILTLVERAEQAVTRDDAERMAEKLRREEFTLEDLRSQMDAVRKMGPVDQLLGMIPDLKGAADWGRSTMSTLDTDSDVCDDRLDDPGRAAAPVHYWREPRKRIARGSGSSVQDVNQLLKQFGQMRKMLKAVKGVTGKRKGKTRRRGGRLGLLGSGADKKRSGAPLTRGERLDA